MDTYDEIEKQASARSDSRKLLDNLDGLFVQMEATQETFKEALEVAAARLNVKPATLRRYIRARVRGERNKVAAEVEQLDLLLDLDGFNADAGNPEPQDEEPYEDEAFDRDVA